ncbi:Conserved_hypothetical protein [Hexamita inflata]|uniref:Uncharacterized protein n=1 Tax=Hexamita inflata TaxID=28002 RepID=A0AA86NJ47_9EUKA|nr:Conserved hypothetical protein [Hexamita inflata]
MQANYVLTSLLICSYKQISHAKYFDTKTQMCNQKLHFNKVTVQYCNKQASLAQLTQSTQIIYSSEGTEYVALYTEAVQNLIVNNSFSSVSLPSFALFGLVKTNIQIQSSQLYVKTPNLHKGALICFQCDLNASQAEFVFVSSGKMLSGLVLHGLNYLDLNQVLVQIRLSGDILGGLYSQTLKSEMSLKETNVSGYFNGTRCGALIAFVSEIITVKVQNTRVCTNDVPNIFQGSDLARISEIIQEDCTVCGDRYYAYGVCLQSLINGVIQLYSLICSNSFVFDGQDCVCPDGQILNGSSCFAILNIMDQIVDKDYNLQYLMGLKSNPNVVSVDSRLLNNISAFNQNLNKEISSINSNILNINTTLNEEIIKDNYLQNRKNQLTAQIQDLVYKIQCNRQYGYSWQNGQCSLLSCIIEGQAVINGVCQCPFINQYITSNKCICPDNTIISAGTCTCSIIGQIMQNKVCVCFTQTAFVKNGACTCGVNSLNISNVCSCPQYSTLVDGVCTCNVIYGQSMIDGSCQCLPPQTFQNGKCTYIVNSVDVNMVCSQQLFVYTFDILDISNNIESSSAFLNGYVFGSGNFITNAYINIKDGVYTGTLCPLFQSQYQFTNIKIQIGTQSFASALQFIGTQKQIQVNCLYITSKVGTSVNSITNVYLLVQQISEGTNYVNNLMINMNITSNACFTLINTIIKQLTVNNYSIFGLYLNQQPTSLISFSVTSCTVILTNITIMPTLFNVGNSSSYFFNTTTGCIIQISNVGIRIGNAQNNQIFNSISSDSNNWYQFGGLVSYIISSTFQITQVIYDCYYTYNTPNIQYSGILVGYSNSNANNIIISNVCLQQFIQSTSIYYYFGVIGQSNGNLTLQSSYVTFTIKATYISSLGTIGAQSSDSQQSYIINLRTTFTVSVDARGDVGAVMGWQEGQNLQIDSCVVFNSSIFAKCYVGGVIGSLQNQLKMNNASVIKTNLSANDNSSGGFIGWSYSCHFFINNSNVQSSRLYCNERIGIILGRNYKSTTFQVINSWSTNNYFYETLQYDCPNLNNAFSDPGC